MGLDAHAVRFLLDARTRGASFEHSAMIGRQSLHIDPESLRQTLAAGGLPIAEEESRRLLGDAHGFCEPLLRLLGASETCSIDLSPYQHASVLHDMNEPLPASLAGRFSIVIDGGSLEHVFNFPRAMSNCMQMLRVGGHFVGVTPANNFMGHGFYQFSPELYFRIFSPGNGFVTERMIIYQERWPNLWHEVRDPEDVKRRVTLVNRFPTSLLVLARKIESRVPFEPVPQQSDYVAWWKESGTASSGPSVRVAVAAPGAPGWALMRRLRGQVTKLVPVPVKRRYQLFKAGGNPFDPDLYTELDH